MPANLLKNHALLKNREESMNVQKMPLPDQITDEELMAAIAKGDRESFRVLAERYMKLLYSVAFRMFPQRADAEDVVQEVLLRLWNKAHLWKEGTGATVSTWLYRLAYNLCIDQKRKSRYKTVELDEAHPDEGKTADRKMQDKQRSAIVRAALQKLPERQRAALVLCHYQGLSNAQAADIMGVTVKAIEGLLVRARQALQQDLKKFREVL